MKRLIRIAVLGVAGRMGQMIVKSIEEDEKVNLIGAAEKQDHTWLGLDVGKVLLGKPNGIIIESDIVNVIDSADVVIDFTSPETSLVALKSTAAAKVAHVIGTTGFSFEEIEKIRLAAQKIPIVRAGNMSLGVNLIAKLTEKVASILDDNFDIEINEIHHNQKVDSPSGTALMFGEAAAKGRSLSLDDAKDFNRNGYNGTRRIGSIGFSSMRGGDIVGEHDVIFAGSGERVILRHIATDRMVFARGAIRAAVWASFKDAGEYNMMDVLGLNDSKI